MLHTSSIVPQVKRIGYRLSGALQATGGVLFAKVPPHGSDRGADFADGIE